MRVMSTWPRMTEISSTQTCYPKTGRRSAPCRTPFRIGANSRLCTSPPRPTSSSLVTSRPSEDLLAVYDAHQSPNGNYLWRVMGRDGLEPGETPLVTQFEKAFENVQ